MTARKPKLTKKQRAVLTAKHPPVGYDEQGTPIVKGRVLYAPDGYFQVRVFCPVCDFRMLHSWTIGDDPSPRASHCWRQDEPPVCPRHYLITVDPELEPEMPRWLAAERRGRGVTGA